MLSMTRVINKKKNYKVTFHNIYFIFSKQRIHNEISYGFYFFTILIGGGLVYKCQSDNILKWQKLIESNLTIVFFNETDKNSQWHHHSPARCSFHILQDRAPLVFFEIDVSLMRVFYVDRSCFILFIP